MPRVAFGPSSSSSFAALSEAVDTIAFDSTVTKVTSKVIKLTADAGETVIRGSNFEVTPIGDDVFLTGGKIKSLKFLAPEAEVSDIRIFKIGLSVPELFSAINDEASGADVTALETLFQSLDWTYNGTDGVDSLPETAISSDGVSLNLAGKDVIKLFGGDDVFFSGDGNDRVYGGDGNDALSGGNDRDKLYGDDDDDVLYGGEGRDRLDGGAGNDELYGGGDRDKLIGGTGEDTLSAGTGNNDMMIGGAGADVFVLVAGDGNNKIRDFSDEDSLDLSAAGDYTATEVGRGVLVEYDGGSALLLGYASVPDDLIV